MFDIYINSFNRVSTLSKLISSVLGLDKVGRVTVFDNNSTVTEVGDVLNSYSEDIRIVLNEQNHGPRGAFHFADKEQDEFFVITDPDLDISECPSDLLLKLSEGLTEYPEYNKVGLSLRIDDLQGYSDSEFISGVISSEKSHWERKLDDNWFIAPIDTTFAMCRPRTGFTYEALRSAPPYSARHIPWYLSCEEEERYIRMLPETHKKGLSWSTILSDNLEKVFK